MRFFCYENRSVRKVSLLGSSLGPFGTLGRPHDDASTSNGWGTDSVLADHKVNADVAPENSRDCGAASGHVRETHARASKANGESAKQKGSFLSMLGLMILFDRGRLSRIRLHMPLPCIRLALISRF